MLEVKGGGISSVQYRTIERPPGDDFRVVLSDPKNLLNTAEKADKETNGNYANTGKTNAFSSLSFLVQISVGIRKLKI